MTERIDPDQVLAKADDLTASIADSARPVADWFHEHEGELFDRLTVASEIADDFARDETEIDQTISKLIGDVVDPVVQVDDGDTRWVGVIDYQKHDFWYEYIEYHPLHGQQRKGVCAQCVKEATYDTEVAYAMPGLGTLTADATIDDVEQLLNDHFAKAHPDVSVAETEIETGASLVAPTSIGGNEAIHKGNMTTEADAEWVDGLHASDIAPTYNDGTTTAHIVGLERFGAEGTSTTSTTYVTAAGSDISFDPDEFKDSAGNLYVRLKGHLKHGATSGTSYCRLYRQNAATAVTGTEIAVTANDGWGVGDSGWVSLSDTGFDSYHLQLKSGDGDTARYNSVLLFFGIPA